MRNGSSLGLQRSHSGSSPKINNVVNKAPAPPLLHNAI
jgi:hypothetical protein